MQPTPQHQLTPPLNNPTPTPLLPEQTTPNPNNAARQPVMDSDLSNYAAYSISRVDFHDIQLRFGRNINKTTSP